MPTVDATAETAPRPLAAPGIRQRVAAQGPFLLGRQASGMVIGFSVVLALTRLIGPEGYGLYAAAYAVTGVSASIARMGTEVYLVRKEDEPASDYDRVFTYLVMSGVGVAGLGLALTYCAAYLWASSAFLPPLRVMLVLVPLTLLSVPAQAMLERELRYREVAAIEVGAHITFGVLAIGLAFMGAGVWAPVTGYAAYQAVSMGATWVTARFVPRWSWSWAGMRPILGFGATYSMAAWLGLLRPVVNPLVIGTALGPAAVGHVAVAQRALEALGFVRRPMQRIALSAFARVQSDPLRLRRALQDGMALQMVAIGPLLALFAALAPWLLPSLLGADWEPVVRLIPLMGAAFLVTSLFGLHNSALYAINRNGTVARFQLLYLTLLGASALLLVPRMGLIGYGLAELLALPSYLALHLPLARQLRIDTHRAVVVLLVFLPPMFSGTVGQPFAVLLWLPLCVALLNRAARTLVLEWRRAYLPGFAR